MEEVRKKLGAGLRYCAVLAVLVLGLASIIGTGDDDWTYVPPTAETEEGVNPIVFVHGFSGNAAQFESQAQRFMANGYTRSELEVYEHDTGTGAPDPAEQTDGLDQVIDDVLQRTGRDHVDLICHSRGAGLCTYYLEDAPERAAKVAHYVPVDSQTNLGVITALGLTDTPGNVPTLALWGEGESSRTVPGATNVYMPEQSHIEICTSAESFVKMYNFFNDSEPLTDQIPVQEGEEVILEGAAYYFPANTGARGTLEIWEIHPVTAQRLWTEPEGIWEIDETGTWGPQPVVKGATYEFAFEHESGEKHYFYREPFWADNFFVRLDTSNPEDNFSLGKLMTKTENHTDILIKRDKELWGDRGDRNDVLVVDGTILFETTGGALAAAATKRLSGLFLMDWGPDKSAMSIPGLVNVPDQSTDLTTPIAAENAGGIFHSLPFMSGLDLYIPADPDRTIHVELTPRGGDGAKQVINLPAWPSSEVRTTVHFRDFVYPRLPVVFVHGFAGSASQFESQAQRFMANGYPVEFLNAYEHDTSGAVEIVDQIEPLDDLIDEILISTGADKVNLIGHSRGTMVSQTYLADPDRAAKVARYINVDGWPAEALPGDVPTLALWGDGRLLTSGEIVGAKNVYHVSQSHIEVTTSKESFVDMFAFFTGSAPVFVDIPEASGDTINIAGKVSYFPVNAGAPGTLEIWEICPDTAKRVDEVALHTINVDATGEWGPVEVEKGSTYEFAFEHPALLGGGKHYFYREPNMADNYFIRLNTSDPADFQSIGYLLTRSDEHTNILITRDKEFWGDQGPALNDSLIVDGTDVFQTGGGSRAAARIKHLSGLFLIDWGYGGHAFIKNPFPAYFYDPHVLGESYLDAPVGIFHELPFMSGLDLHMPATDPPDRAIPIILTPRGGGGTQTIRVPNWISDDVRVSVHFRDFVQRHTPG